AVSGHAWEHTLADWEWVLGVNLWGVIHGVRTFVPVMLRQGDEGHIVNTGSVAGLTSNPFMSIYNVTKHAVVTLSETLHKDLGLLGVPIKVSVLCPGFVRTRILEADRNRPANLRETAVARHDPELEEMAREAIATGLPPAEAAAQVVDAVKNERFYVLTHPELTPRVPGRREDLLEARNPSQPLTLAGPRPSSMQPFPPWVWRIPEHFNIGVACTDAHLGTPVAGRDAVVVDRDDGAPE